MRAARVARIARQGDDPNTTFEMQKAEHMKKARADDNLLTLNDLKETRVEQERGEMYCLEQNAGNEKEAKRADRQKYKSSVSTLTYFLRPARHII